MHAYPMPMVYAFAFDGKIAIPGLRGYAAYKSIEPVGADNQREQRILDWMYDPVPR